MKNLKYFIICFLILSGCRKEYTNDIWITPNYRGGWDLYQTINYGPDEQIPSCYDLDDCALRVRKFKEHMKNKEQIKNLAEEKQAEKE